MLTETQEVPDDKVHGGNRTGAGRPKTKELNEFGKWVEASGKTKEEISGFIGVSVSFLNQLSRGQAIPSLKGAVKIEEITEGAVDCKFWIKSDT